MTISKELLDELLSGVDRPEDLLGDKGLMTELKVRLSEALNGRQSRLTKISLPTLSKILCKSKRVAQGPHESSFHEQLDGRRSFCVPVLLPFCLFFERLLVHPHGCHDALSLNTCFVPAL